MGHAGKKLGLCFGDIDRVLLFHVQLPEFLHLLHHDKHQHKA